MPRRRRAGTRTEVSDAWRRTVDALADMGVDALADMGEEDRAAVLRSLGAEGRRQGLARDTTRGSERHYSLEGWTRRLSPERLLSVRGVAHSFLAWRYPLRRRRYASK